LDTTDSGTGGDTGHGDSNGFTLDTTNSGTGGDTGVGDSNGFTLDTTDSGTGGDTGHGDSNGFTLDTTDSGTGGDTGVGDSNEFTLDTTDSGTGGDTGHGDSNGFTLDTTDSGTAGNTGHGDSNGFALDTTDSGKGGDTGHGDSNGFTLDTTDSGTGGDIGYGDSNGFTLDTTDSGTGGDTGVGDSNEFALDTTPPVITLIGNTTTTHPASTPYVDQGANWTDLVDGSGSLKGSGKVDHNTPGIYQIAYNYTDQAGNAAQTIYRFVQVVDQQAPTITLNGDSNITHEAGTTYIDAGAYWSDSVDGKGTAYTNGTVVTNVPGIYTISYSFTDSSGNAAKSVPRTIEVVDTTPPVIILIGDANIIHPVGFVYTDSGAFWTDAVDGQGKAQTKGQVNITEPGIYSITYHASDKSGNFALSTSRTVEVVNQRPEFTIDPISIPENEGFATDLHASDLDINQSLTFAIIGGADESFFMLNAITGTLSFIASPDYENPMDADSDNRYEVILAVSDGHDSTESPFIIKITDVWENQA
ncbi:MAG: DUF5011 domain-containing protein, partial [Euryarchaeota archaeon]|nr:DUF5011 domain-containing protein [Euryarchaeota archaeon]